MPKTIFAVPDVVYLQDMLASYFHDANAALPGSNPRGLQPLRAGEFWR